MKQDQLSAQAIRERERDLHASWPGRGDSYWSDGAVHAETFVGEALRIVFVLKEANAQSKTAAGVKAEHLQDLRDFLKAGGRPATWDNVACWAHALLDQARGRREWPWAAYTVEVEKMKANAAIRGQHLRRVAVMNLSKGDGKAESDTDFAAMCKADDVLNALRAQHALYRAHLTVCCGSSVALVMRRALGIEKWTPTMRGLQYSRRSDGSIVLWFAHPEARLGGQFLLYALIDAVAEITGLKGDST